MRLARRILKRISVVLAGTAVAAGLTLTAASTAAYADDPKPANCPDGYQIGSTATGTWNGMTIASVKQYYSPQCDANWAYVYIWEGFRNQGYGWGVRTYIDAKSDATAWGFVDRNHW